MGQAMQAFSVPCWWVSWWLWRAGCISQDTYLLYYITMTTKTKITWLRISCPIEVDWLFSAMEAVDAEVDCWLGLPFPEMVV